ncbi:methyltransferase domain-containing protein [Virgibacillus dakarensis]|nr:MULTISPECIES: class I SAM-dependent methyltransferase [Bacillaceae]MBT2214359.1 methyltransferase domain-containing protein [Virgibacillus dakarensis]MTW85037.1 methyltransferase domain-containing protein [Virgibacillus dakarensis]
MVNPGKKNDMWDAELYDGKHAFVSTYGNDLINVLEPKKGEAVLDLGCGTGDIAKRLYDFGVHVTGIDKSKNMILQAQRKYPNITFQVGDATELKFRETFDAVFSNATLHWIKAANEALCCIFDSLKKGGRFVAEFGGKGNVQTITSAIRKQFQILELTYCEERFPWYFPSIGEYTTLMEQAGFKVIFARQFERPTPLEGMNGLKNWIDMFGKTMFAGLDNGTVTKIVTNVENDLAKAIFHDQHWIADYHRIRVMGIRE